MPPSEKVMAERMQYIKMKGNETFKVAVRTLEEVARETLAANHLLSRISTSMCPIKPICAFSRRWRSAWASARKSDAQYGSLRQYVRGLDSHRVG